MLAGIFLFLYLVMITFEDYEPYTLSFTQVGRSAVLQQYRVKASRCWVRATSLWFLVQTGVSAKFQLVPLNNKTSPSAIKLVTPNLWSPSQWPLECLNDSHCTVSLTALTLTARHHLQTHTHTHSQKLTYTCYPCCFQNVRSAWAVLIVLIVTNSSVHTMMNIIVITVIIAATLVLHILRGSKLWFFCLFVFFISVITFTASENSIILIIIVVVIRMIIPGLMSVF